MASKKSSSVVTDRGQITIPREMRRRLGIEPGTTLRFQTEGRKLVATKEASDDPVSRVFGVAGKLKTDTIIAQLRGKK
jgi:antitoxin PrlF